MAAHRMIAGLLVAQLLLPIATTAIAAPTSPSDLAAAKQHFERGVQLFDEADFQAALIEFKRAHEITGRWEVLVNIGMSNYQLQNYAEALRHLERYLAEGGASVPKEKHDRVAKDIADLRGRVAKLTIVVDVAGAEISIDDQPVGKSPLPEAILVSAGKRRVTVRAPGRPEATKTVEIAGGDEGKVVIEVPASTMTGGPTEPTTRTTTHTSTWTWVGIGVAGAGLVVGGVFGVLAISKRNDLDAACVSKHCYPSSQKDIDALSLDATISSIGWGVAIVGAGIAVFGLLNPSTRTEKIAPSTALTVQPWIGVGSAGIRGSF